MVRRHDEPLEVATGERAATSSGSAAATAAVLHDDAPRSFVWRGRRYTVCAVLDAWQERRAWWREVGEHPDGPTDTERRVWRVEARPPSGTAGVFDLGRDDDHWLLLRAHD
ncbi:DUF6504 family protein [Phycicoccus sonneratiae]|uniref:DUF6504 domain-containing protein n=1 Tax=Phycicoccus sonneratiae TaxID=2807628 RepID=A0ABS2CRF3_9MICO|nr:DUF6504 family protein [Phycicoccus sonneraticus]MBM6402469.1 hypothetical protein [Phycicoccus sonneraticus]